MKFNLSSCFTLLACISAVHSAGLFSCFTLLACISAVHSAGLFSRSALKSILTLSVSRAFRETAKE
jgi:hypothetical protein